MHASHNKISNLHLKLASKAHRHSYTKNDQTSKRVIRSLQYIRFPSEARQHSSGLPAISYSAKTYNHLCIWTQKQKDTHVHLKC